MKNLILIVILILSLIAISFHHYYQLFLPALGMRLESNLTNANSRIYRSDNLICILDSNNEIFMVNMDKRTVTVPNPRYIEMKLFLLWRRDLTEGVRINNSAKMETEHQLVWGVDRVFFSYGRKNENYYSLRF